MPELGVKELRMRTAHVRITTRPVGFCRLVDGYLDIPHFWGVVEFWSVLTSRFSSSVHTTCLTMSSTSECNIKPTKTGVLDVHPLPGYFRVKAPLLRQQ
jgi:hypothetical protein